MIQTRANYGRVGLACFSAAFSVGMGAFAAHGLKAYLDPEALGWIRTGAEYQMWHSLAALGFALIAEPTWWVRRVSELFFWGILFFSGSLYLMALTGIRLFGILTPIGGVSFLLAWVLLGVHFWKRRPL